MTTKRRKPRGKTSAVRPSTPRKPGGAVATTRASAAATTPAPSPGDLSPPEAQHSRSTPEPSPGPAPRPEPAPTSIVAAADDEAPPSSMSVEAVQAQIRELESKLDEMLRRSQRRGSVTRSEAERAAQAVAERIEEALPIERPGGDDGNVMDAARELLSSDYYLRQWGRIGMRNRSEEVDDFGLDPKYEARWRPLFDLAYRRYFRVETVGAELVPSEGRCLVVANHSGTIPMDGPMLRTALRNAHPAQRELRWLAEDFVFYLPFVGAFMNRIGAVRACPENAERLLSQERLVAVFPEGVKGIGKLYRDRYKLQRFGRGGFIRLALRSRTPIVPCAIVGAEEASPMLARLDGLGDLLGLPYVPVTPTFPALGPLGLLPAPTKWRIELGEPLHFDAYGPDAADDTLLVGRLAERVRAAIQSMLDRSLARRRSVWFG